MCLPGFFYSYDQTGSLSGRMRQRASLTSAPENTQHQAFPAMNPLKEAMSVRKCDIALVYPEP